MSSKAEVSSNTRDRLIDAVFDVVARDGIDGASVKVIAAAADVTPGLLHYHFPTRDALLEAALRREADAYRAQSRKRRESTSPDKQIDAYFKSTRTLIGSRGTFFKARLAFAAKALSSPALARVLRELNQAAVEESALTFAASRGSAKPTAREREIAAMMKASFDGLMLSWLSDPSFPMAEAGKLLEETVRAALAAR